MDHEISQEGIDGRDIHSCARPYTADCHGTRNNHIVRESLMRSHSRLGRIPTSYGCQHDCPMVEGDIFEDTPSGVSSFKEKVLGETFLGKRLSRGDDGNHNRSNSRTVYFRTGRRADDG